MQSASDLTQDDDGSNSKLLVRNFDGTQNPIGVHQSGSDISITFDQSYASSSADLSNQERVEFVAARINTTDDDGAPVSATEALDLIENTDAANRNASFQMLLNSDDDDPTSLNADGEKTVTANLDSGYYVIFASVHSKYENGFEVGDDNQAADNITLDGNATVIGIDQVTVHEDSSTVTEPSAPAPGQDLTFDVDASSGLGSELNGNVTHAVAVYDSSTFEDATFETVVAEDALGPGFNQSTDVQLEHSISTLNGVRDVEQGTTLNGQTLSDDRVSEPVSASAAIDFFADELGSNDPNTHAIGSEELDASVTVINSEQRNTGVTVETFGNWSTGEYRYVAVSAADKNDSKLSTTTGTITLTEANPAISVTGSVDFGNVTNGSSLTDTAFIENTGNAPLNLSSISVSGEAFSTSESGSVLAPGDTRTVDVTFAPSSTGDKTGTLTVQSNATNTATSLSGTGVEPAGGELAIDRQTLRYGGTRATTNETKSVTITSAGDAPLRLSTIELSGVDDDQYTITNGGSAGTLPVDSIRKVDIRFEPTVRGLQSAQLDIESNDSDQAVTTVNLYGTGTAPEVTVNTAEPVEFRTSAGSTVTQAIEIENTGNAALDTTATGLSGPFSVSSNGQTTLKPGETAEITIAYNPSTIGSNYTELALETNNPLRDGDETVKLDGTALGPEVSVAPTENSTTNRVSLGEGTIGSSVTQGFLVVNDGTAPLDIESVSIDKDNSGVFSVSGTPTGTVAPGDAQVIDVTASLPNSPGDSTGTLTVETNGTNKNTVTRDLSATALNVSYDSDLNTLDFGAVAAGNTDSRSIKISNDATGADATTLTVDPSTISGDAFRLVDASQTLELAPGEDRRISVVYQPDSASADDSATLNLATNDPTARNPSIGLDGEGADPSIVFTDASPVTFGPVAPSTDATKTLTLRNDGEATISDLSVEFIGSTFSVDSSTLPSSLDPGESTSVAVTYSQSSAGSASGDFKINGTDGSSTVRATTVLSGTTEDASASVSDDSLDFGFTGTGESVTRIVSLSNTGITGTTLTVSSVSVTGSSAYSVTDQPSSVAGGDSETVTVELSSSTTGQKDATLDIATSDGIRRVDLSGQVSAPDAEFEASSVDFGNVSVDDSAEETVTLTNDGGITVAVQDITANGDFSLPSDPGTFTLVPGQSRTITVSAAPSSTGAISHSLDVDTNASASDATTTLKATGVAPDISVSPSSGSTVAFGDTPAGSAATKDITVTNDGTSTLTVGSVSVTGADSGAYSATVDDLALSPGASETISVTFAPSTDTSYDSATVELTEINDPDTDSLSYGLSGTGTTTEASFDSASVSFGTIDLGNSSTKALTLSNTGGADTTINVGAVEVRGNDPTAFSVSGIDSSTDIDGGDSATFDVTAKPAVRGSNTALVAIKNDSDVTVATASVSAVGSAPGIDVVNTVGFEDTRIGASTTKSVEIENTGNAPLTVSDLGISGADSGQFTVAEDSVTVPAASTEEVTVTYQPAANSTSDALSETLQEANLTITSDASDEIVGLDGAPITSDVRVGQKSLRYGTATVGQTITRSVTVRNSPSATATVNVTSLGIGGQDSDSYTVTGGSTATLAPGDSETVTVEFTPQSTGSKYATLNVLTDSPRGDAGVVFLSNTKTLVNVTYGSVDIAYTSPEDGAQPTIDVTRGQNVDAEIRTIQTTANSSGATPNFETRFEFSDSAFDDASALSNADTFRYMNATTNLSDGEFENTTFQFGVSKAALADAGESAGNVTLYHDNGTGYEALETTRVGETRTQFLYTATADSFSVFTIGGDRQPQTSDGADDTDTGDSDTGDSDTGDSDTGDSGSGSAGSGGGGGGGGGGVGPVVRTLTPAADGSVAATVRSLTSGQTVTFNIGQGPTPGGATLDQLSLTGTGDASDVRFRITQTDGPGEGVPANDRARSVLSYINVDTENLPNEDRTPGTFTFTVSEDRLAELDASPDEVELSRYHNGSWHVLETTHLGDNRFEAETPGFSWFAVGVQDGSASVTNATLSPTTVETDESATVTATIENTRSMSQNVTLNLTVDGETLRSQTVTVAADSETTETFTLVAPEPGSYDISVNDQAAGTLTVTESTTESSDGTPTDRITEAGPDVEPGGIQPLTIVLVLVVVVGTALLAYAYRRTGP